MKCTIFLGGKEKNTRWAIDLDFRRYESHMYVPLCWCQLLSTFNLCWQRTCTYRWWFHGFFLAFIWSWGGFMIQFWLVQILHSWLEPPTTVSETVSFEKRALPNGNFISQPLIFRDELLLPGSAVTISNLLQVHYFAIGSKGLVYLPTNVP